jgi:hypothetical protein
MLAKRSIAKDILQHHPLVSKFIHVEQTTLGSYITFSDILDPVHDSGTDSSCYSVVVGLANSTDSGNWRVGFEEVVLGEVCRRKEKPRSATM